MAGVLMKLSLLLLAALPLCGQFRYTFPWVVLDSATSNTDLNSAASGGYSASWAELGFTPSVSKTLSKVRFNVGAVTGTLTSSDVCIDLYSDSNGSPNASLELRCTVTTTPTGAAWTEVTGFTTALTRNTVYHLVWKNADATPASNYYRITSLTVGDGNAGGSVLTGSGGGYRYQTSTTSGGSWTAANRMPGAVIEYSDGTKEGFPLKSVSTLQIYGTRKGGLEMTLSGASPHLAFRGIGVSVAKTGSPTALKLSAVKGTGNSRSTICTTTTSIAGGAMSTTRHLVYAWCDEGRVMVAPGDTIGIVGETTNTSDASTNRTNIGILQFWSQDSAMVSPFATARTLLSTDSGSTWSTTADEMPQMFLILDDSRPIQGVTGGAVITQ